MTHRTRVAFLTIAALMLVNTAPAVHAAGTVLASYSFDDDTPTGPDTFRIFQYSKGTVRLTSAYQVSGQRAIELRDVEGDGSMPEIQGYFPAQSKGRLDAHFSFLTATPQEELNIALAGPQWFRLEKDGIGFWLKSVRGQLVHYSAGVAKPLFPLEAFVWYSVDLAYDLGAGRYDLTIRRERQDEPLVALVGQANAPGQPSSAVDKFSFVGEPFGDKSNVVYYVDDIVLRTTEKLAERPFVAPGRRKLFVDAFVEYRARESARPRCLPASGPEDFGLNAQDLGDLAQAGALDLLTSVATATSSAAPEPTATLVGEARRKLEGALRWSRGCAALDRREAQAALADFVAAGASVPEARLYGLSQALALVALGRAAQADERLALEATAWGGDARYAVALATAGTARGDLERAEAWLRSPAEAALARDGDPLLRRVREQALTSASLDELKRARPRDWQEAVSDVQASEQYFYVLLWRGQAPAARDYAVRMVERFRMLALDPVAWVARAGDASFYGQDIEAARRSYAEALQLDAALRIHYWSLVLKLCDVAFVTGDLATERALREQYYGALREP